jgi:uncharacterized membrane protein YhaH (DUF805 family)
MPQSTESQSLPPSSISPQVTTAGPIRRLWLGRISAATYFFGVVGTLLMAYIIVTGLIAALSQTGRFAAASLLLYIPAFFLIACLAIRRCHDLGWSGWLSIVSFLPFVGWIFNLVLLFKSGDSTINKYGPPPEGNRGFLAKVFNY